MKKKPIIISLLVIILVVCLIAYFKPMKLSDTISKNSSFSIMISDMSVKDSEPYIDTQTYDKLTDKQKTDIIELLNDYTYQRKPSTPFSSDSISELNESLIVIYAYENNKISNTLFISSGGDFVSNSKSYKLKNAEKLNSSIKGILS